MIQGNGKKKLEEALAVIYSENRFTAYFFQNCEIVPNQKEHFTAGITTRNGSVYMEYSEKFVEQLTHNQILGLLCHEMGHVVRGHIKRTVAQHYSHSLANRCQDMLINEDILVNSNNYLPQQKLELPPNGCFLPPKYKEKWKELSWEDLYKLMKEDAPPPKKKEEQLLSTEEVIKIAQEAEKHKIVAYFFSYRKILYKVEAKNKTFIVTENTKTKTFKNASEFKHDFPDRMWKLASIFTFGEAVQLILNGLTNNRYLRTKNEAYTIDINRQTNSKKSKIEDFEITLTSFPSDENPTTSSYSKLATQWPERTWENIPDPSGGEGDGDGEKGEGEGEKGEGKEKGEGDGFDEHGGWDEIDENAIEQVLERSASAAKGIGNSSDNLIKTFEDIRKRDVSFVKKIKSTVDFMACRDRQPSTKRLHRMKIVYEQIEKGWDWDFKQKLIVGIDTSGSMMDGKTLEACMGVIEGLAAKYSLEVVQVDTEIKKVGVYKPGDWKTFPVTGGGGTAFEKFFNEYLLKRKDAVIMLTDGCVNTKGLRKYDNTIWCVTEDNWKKPFGKCVYIDPARL